MSRHEIVKAIDAIQESIRVNGQESKLTDSLINYLSANIDDLEKTLYPAMYPYKLIVESTKATGTITGEIVVQAESPEQAEIQTRERFASGELGVADVYWHDIADAEENIEIVDFDREHPGSYFPSHIF